MGAADSSVSRERFLLEEIGQPAIALQVQRPAVLASGDVVYVHGATFGADLSIFYRFDGRSWADALNDIGLAVWGFDFPGYGRSERYPADLERPAGRIGDAIAHLRRVVAAVRARNGDRPVCLVAHSWGGAVAGRVPPSVATPTGPLADIGALWSGQALYDPSLVVAPTLLARGEWDSLCTDADAQRLLSALGAALKEDAKIERATHLMHLELQRTVLHDRVNRFLQRTAQ